MTVWSGLRVRFCLYLAAGSIAPPPSGMFEGGGFPEAGNGFLTSNYKQRPKREQKEAMHAAWQKAVKVLPDFTIVHKQDWFVKERYAGRLGGDIEQAISRLARGDP